MLRVTEMDTNEERALQIGANRIRLKKRLLEARSVLANEFRQRFKKYTFDFENKRLVSSDNKLALQWQLRDRPNEPESYENQQTSVGSVLLRTI